MLRAIGPAIQVDQISRFTHLGWPFPPPREAGVHGRPRSHRREMLPIFTTPGGRADVPVASASGSVWPSPPRAIFSAAACPPQVGSARPTEAAVRMRPAFATSCPAPRSEAGEARAGLKTARRRETSASRALSAEPHPPFVLPGRPILSLPAVLPHLCSDMLSATLGSGRGTDKVQDWVPALGRNPLRSRAPGRQLPAENPAMVLQPCRRREKPPPTRLPLVQHGPVSTPEGGRLAVLFGRGVLNVRDTLSSSRPSPHLCSSGIPGDQSARHSVKRKLYSRFKYPGPDPVFSSAVAGRFQSCIPPISCIPPPMYVCVYVQVNSSP